ncbi:Replicase polyprotein 1a [Frankliniella fusca]|uniref:Replicase polyprotein 1a n=1 Tax=Frankliniella fusca TaxID=407009 RepID=A0AAE1LL26_9NEOP|nr:Replicase polyprotein 1a [Frankliniella fusca]
MANKRNQRKRAKKPTLEDAKRQRLVDLPILNKENNPPAGQQSPALLSKCSPAIPSQTPMPHPTESVKVSCSSNSTTSTASNQLAGSPGRPALQPRRKFVPPTLLDPTRSMLSALSDGNASSFTASELSVSALKPVHGKGKDQLVPASNNIKSALQESDRANCIPTTSNDPSVSVLGRGQRKDTNDYTVPSANIAASAAQQSAFTGITQSLDTPMKATRSQRAMQQSDQSSRGPVTSSQKTPAFQLSRRSHVVSKHDLTRNLQKEKEIIDSTDSESDDDEDEDSSFNDDEEEDDDSNDDDLEDDESNDDDLEDGNEDNVNSDLVGGEDNEGEVEDQEDGCHTNVRQSRMRNQNSHKATRVKRRIRQSISTARQLRKSARNKGEAYTTDKGKEVPAKKPSALGRCNKKCASKVPAEVQLLLCNGLWQGLADHDRRSSFVASLVDKKPKASQKLNLPSTSSRKPRQYSYKYHLPINGDRIEVCKNCFTKTLAVSAKFIEVAMLKKSANVAGIVDTDSRGRASHSTVTEGQRQEVRSHLDSFPKYKSHYAREKTDKNFLDSHLTKKILYEEYKQKCSTTPVSRWVFEKEFENMGLKIKPYKMDTCNTCDKLACEIMYAKDEEQRAVKLQEQQNHHTCWEEALDNKHKDIQEAKSNDKVEVVVFDMQQCLPTPHLQTSVVFYKRQLWVYNLTLHICSSDKSVHNMWHEGEGERGPNQVGSALYHYLMTLPEEVESVTLWSDTCGGQNKNSIITATLQTVLLHKKSLKTIDQKFLVPGHTHLECDRDHSIIESKKKQAAHIFVPRDWFNLVQTANKRFSVNRLTQDKMLDFKSLLKGRDSPLIKRNKDVSGDVFSWKSTVWLRHSTTFAPGEVGFKKSFNEAENFKFLNLKRRKAGALVLQPALAYDGPLPISVLKKQDLLSLLYLIDPECHGFYQSLLTSADEDFHPDLRASSDQEDSEDE